MCNSEKFPFVPPHPTLLTLLTSSHPPHLILRVERFTSSCELSDGWRTENHKVFTRYQGLTDFSRPRRGSRVGNEKGLASMLRPPTPSVMRLSPDV